ncbi:MAG: type III pantothenate kinase [Campylobacterota bacterium]|nr:type III pantothenate kinase [Campylobacterota bacterium]
MILCDIGNTTFHFNTKKKDFKIGVKDSLKKLFKYKEIIYFISVNEKATKKLLKNYPNSVNIKDIISFDTSYVGMGTDRKVVCSYLKNAIIVDSGSAITVDIMKKGEHKGGFILPGIEAYKKIYPQISKKLVFQFSNNINLDKMPLITNDAINYAILNSIVLPILKAYKKYKMPLYFTGGNSQLLLNCFNNIDIKYEEDLIFKSMAKIIKKNKDKKRGK